MAIKAIQDRLAAKMMDFSTAMTGQECEAVHRALKQTGHMLDRCRSTPLYVRVRAMTEFNGDLRRAVDIGVLDLAQIEHVATKAAELGDTEIEKLCDDALAGATSADIVTCAVHEDERYVEWIDRGMAWGWEVRR
jgi:hypothetical protein